MTASSGSVFTAAQFNTNVRDNLNETLPAKATQAGQIFVATGTNSISPRLVDAGFVQTLESTTSTTYTDLATIGPTVTATTGVSAIIAVYCNQFSSGGLAAWMSYGITGATTSVADDNRSVQLQSTGGQHLGVMVLHQSLTAGSNVFTAKYRVSTSGTGSFSSRRLVVIPL
jgi:hypothetical protein